MDFGEIIEPSSRAFWEEFDNIEENLGPPLKLEWNWITEEQAALKLEDFDFIIIEGSDIFEFINSVIPKDKKILCKLKNHKITVISFKNKIICVSEENDLNLGGSITLLLTNWMEKAKNVVTISVLPQTSYKEEDFKINEEVAFIKEISLEENNPRQLQPPNFITGICAGVASWRYFNDLPINCYVAYIDSGKFDEKSSKPIIKVLQSIGLKCADNYSPKFRNESLLYT